MVRPSVAIRTVIGLGILGGCSPEPAAPTVSTLNVNFVTPSSDDGAVLFTISGGPVESVAAAGYSVYSARIDPNTLRVIVTGDLGSGIIARIRVADDGQLSRYSATINQVAARGSYTQQDPAPYTLSLTP